MSLEVYWEKLALTAGLRPVFLQGEIEVLVCPKVSIYFGTEKKHRSGFATLTTHRILWVNNLKKPTLTLSLHLRHVRGVESKAGFIGLSSPKITLYLHPHPALAVPAASPAPAAAAAAAAPAPVAAQSLYPSVFEATWSCPACTFANKKGHLQCSMCGTERPPNVLDVVQAAPAPTLAPAPAATPPPAGAAAAAVPNPPVPGFFRLSFHGHDRDAFLEKLSPTMAATAWLTKEEAKKAVKADFSVTSAGISGIKRSVQAKHRGDSKEVQAAFSDLSALMSKAKDMVALAEKYAATLQSGSEEDKKQQNELDGLLHNMGIASPVTKSSAGAAYHMQLSRQLADWLAVPMERAGGMLTLTDLFCIFNRARGTELVSPEDLLHACQLFPELNLPFRLRKFDSGVVVVEAAGHSDQRTAEQILSAMCRLDQSRRVRAQVEEKATTPITILGATDQKTTETRSKTAAPAAAASSDTVPADDVSISAVELAAALGISLVLAKQQLLISEALGVLCRDQSLQGLRFHRNFFLLS